MDMLTYQLNSQVKFMVRSKFMILLKISQLVRRCVQNVVIHTYTLQGNSD